MVSKVIDGLYVGSASSVRQLSDAEANQFDYIVTLGYFDRLGYSRPEKSATGDKYVFNDGKHEYADFVRVADFVYNKLVDGNTILVHCQAGCSRSPSVCAAVLGRKQGVNPVKALEHVKARHDNTNPSTHLQASLNKYVFEHL